MGGSKPLVLGLIIANPLHQILYFPTNGTVLLDCLDFIVLFTIDFQWWCFVIQSIAPVAPKEVDVKNVVKSSQCSVLAGCQVQMVSHLTNALQHGEGSNVAILKLPWAL